MPSHSYTTNNMRKFLIIFSCVAVTLAARSQEATKEISAEPFTRIEIGNNAKVILHKSENHKVILTGDPDVIEKISVDVNENELDIDGKGKIRADIYLASLSGLDISGAAAVSSDDVFSSNELEIDVSGAGSITLNVQADKIISGISGAGAIKLQGTARELMVDISGTGSMNALGLQVSNCTADISGAGSCKVDVRDTLIIDISGTGAVEYKTPPAVINKDVTGFGKANGEISAGGENGSNDEDTVRINIGRSRVVIISDNKVKKKKKKEEIHTHWGGVQLGLHGYVNNEGTVNSVDGFDFLELKDEKSVTINLNLLKHDFHLIKNRLMFVVGLGLSMNDLRFRENARLTAGAPFIQAVDDTVAEFKKNKLTMTFLTAPLMFEVSTSDNVKRAFHFGAGIVLAYRLGSHTKIVYEEGDKKKKDKTYDDFNLNPFRADAVVNLGHRNFNVFFNYSLTELFKPDEGPAVNTFAAGISLVTW